MKKKEEQTTIKKQQQVKNPRNRAIPAINETMSCSLELQ